MWLTNYVTQNSIKFPKAEKGKVMNSNADSVAVVSSGEHKQTKYCTPYGIVSRPPNGEYSVVLPLDDGEVSIGSVQSASNIEPGEIMLSSSGGASIMLKNNGKIFVNGEELKL